MNCAIRKKKAIIDTEALDYVRNLEYLADTETLSKEAFVNDTFNITDCRFLKKIKIRFFIVQGRSIQVNLQIDLMFQGDSGHSS